MIEVLLAATLAAASVPAYAAEEHQFNVPDEDATSAIHDFAAQAHVQIVVAGDKVVDKHLNRVEGKYSTDRGLGILLADSGLTPKYMENRAIALVDESGGNSSEGVYTDIRVAQAPSMPVAKLAQGESNNPDANSQIEEVIVTAQRVAENVNKVPISMAVLSQRDLDDRHIESIADLASVVPGLSVGAGSSGSQASGQVNIRGVFSSGNAATTGIYLDETSMDVRQFTLIGFSGTPEPDLFDLERVEVLRGPQGTLFGAGAMGGAVRYITTQPNLDVASGYTKQEVSVNSAGAPGWATGFAYGAPIIPGELGFRVSGYYHSDGGFIDIQDPWTHELLRKNGNSADAYSFRPAVTFVPIEGLSITPAFYFDHKHSEEPPYYWVNSPYPTYGAYSTGFGAHQSAPFTDDLRIPSLTIKYSRGGILFESDSAYLDQYQPSIDDYSNLLPGDFGVGAINPKLQNFTAFDYNIPRTTAWQQQFRLSSGDDPSARLNWVVGAFFRHSHDAITQYVGPDVTPITEQFNPPETSYQWSNIPDYVQGGTAYASYGVMTTVTQEEAFFGDMSWLVLSHVKLAAGIRVSNIALTDQNITEAGPLDGVTYSSTHLPDATEHPVTPRLSLSYDYTDAAMVYATAAKGFRPGGGNATSAQSTDCESSAKAYGYSSVPASFSSDSLWSYELGTKGSYLNQRVQVQASAYYIDWTNIQNYLPLQSCGQNFTDNLGKVTSQGIDLQLQALITEGLKWGANVGYDNVYYRQTLRVTPTSKPLVSAGDKVGVVPWTAASILDYSRDAGWLWNEARSYIRLDYRWTDGAPRLESSSDAGFDTKGIGYTDRAYGTVNVRLGITRKGLDVSAFVNNATNAKPLHGVGDYMYPIYNAIAIPPLTSGLTLFYHF